MSTKAIFVAYLTFLLFVAIWLGAGFYDTLSTSFTWYQDPMQHVNHLYNHPVPGAINPFPIFVVLLTFAAIPSLVLFIKFSGNGKTEALVSITGTMVLLAVTFVYFVPTLINIFENRSAFSDEQIISMSHQWIILNAVRLFALMVLFIVGLLGLAKFYKQ